MKTTQHARRVSTAASTKSISEPPIHSVFIESISPSVKRISHIPEEDRSIMLPVKEKQTENPFPRTVKDPGRESSTLPLASKDVMCPVEPLMPMAVPCSTWLKNNAESSSVEERMFVLAANSHGFDEAVRLASDFRWKCERPKSELSFMSMKSNPKTSDEYSTFENALKTVLSVPRSEMQHREQEYQEQRKEQKKKRAKTSPAVRASRDKG